MITQKKQKIHAWHDNQAYIYTFQGESGIKTVKFQLTDDNGNISLSDASSVAYQAKLPNNKSVFINCNISDSNQGIISFTIPTGITRYVGTTIGTITVTTSNGTLKFGNIIIEVAPNDDSDIEATEQFSALEEALHKIALITPEGTIEVTDTVAANDYKPVTSNAVYNSLVNKADLDAYENVIELSRIMSSNQLKNYTDVNKTYVFFTTGNSELKSELNLVGNAMTRCIMNNYIADYVHSQIIKIYHGHPSDTNKVFIRTIDKISSTTFTDITIPDSYIAKTKLSDNLQSEIDGKADKSTVDTKQSLANMFSTKQNLSNKESSYPSIKYLENYYYDIDYVDDLLDEKANTSDINTALDLKSNKSELTAGLKEKQNAQYLTNTVTTIDDFMAYNQTNTVYTGRMQGFSTKFGELSDTVVKGFRMWFVLSGADNPTWYRIVLFDDGAIWTALRSSTNFSQRNYTKRQTDTILSEKASIVEVSTVSTVSELNNYTDMNKTYVFNTLPPLSTALGISTGSEICVLNNYFNSTVQIIRTARNVNKAFSRSYNPTENTWSDFTDITLPNKYISKAKLSTELQNELDGKANLDAYENVNYISNQISSAGALNQLFTDKNKTYIFTAIPPLSTELSVTPTSQFKLHNYENYQILRANGYPNEADGNKTFIRIYNANDNTWSNLADCTFPDNSITKAKLSDELQNEIADKSNVIPAYIRAAAEEVADKILSITGEFDGTHQPAFTNQLLTATESDGSTIYNNGLGYKAGYRLNSSNEETEQNGFYITGYIHCAPGDIVRLKNISFNNKGTSISSVKIVAYKSDKSFLSTCAVNNMTAVSGIFNSSGDLIQFTTAANCHYFRLSCYNVNENSVITINEEISGYTNQLLNATDENGNPYNDGKGYKTDYRLNSSGAEKNDYTGICCTGFIPCKAGDVIRFKNVTVASSTVSAYIAKYDSNKTFVAVSLATNDIIDNSYTVTGSSTAYVRFSLGAISDDSIITVNEEIEGNETIKSTVPFNLAFITDLHYDDTQIDRYSAAKKAMDVINETAPIDVEIMGGDYCNNYTATSGGTAEEAQEDISKCKKIFSDKSRRLWLRGNHDSNGYPNERLPKAEVYNRIFRAQHTLDGFVENPNDPYGCYGYMDFDNAKIRLIAVNTSDNDDFGTATPEQSTYTAPIINCHNIGTKQLQWIADKALDFSDKTNINEWGVIFVSHVPLYNSNSWNNSHTYVDDSGTSWDCNLINLVNLTTAYRDKTSYSATNNGETISKDFSEDTDHAKILCFISGHTHALINISYNSFNFISCPNANGGASQSSDGESYTKTAIGTINETALSVISVDRTNQKIHVFCYGAGYDREFDI